MPAESMRKNGEKILVRGPPGGTWWLSSHVPLRQRRVISSDPRCGPIHHLPSHAVAGVPHIKKRKMGMDVSSGPAFLSKKRRIGRC